MLARSAWTVLLIFGLLVVGTGCPGREPPPAPPPEVVVPEEPPEPPRASDDDLEVTQLGPWDGFAEIVVKRDPANPTTRCVLDWKTERSLVGAGKVHRWRVVSDCAVAANVELINFQTLDPILSGKRDTTVQPAARQGMIVLRIRPKEDVPPGIYTYQVRINDEIYDPEIEIRDPPM